MKIRILTSNDGHPCGAVVDIDDAVARGWITRGDAEAVTEVAAERPADSIADLAEAATSETSKETVVDPSEEEASEDGPLETAAEGDVETAMKPKAKKR